MIFVGGCAGSTSGGLKMFRFEILWQDIRKECRRLVYPNGVFPDKITGRPARDSLVRDVQVFVLCYVFSYAVLVLILAFYGLDFMTALSGAAAAVANVGPGLGETIGPAGNYSSLPDGAKWAMGVGMILGRLEFETVFVMMTSHFWRD
jgi:trk system potassium uptake protein TrkH